VSLAGVSMNRAAVLAAACAALAACGDARHEPVRVIAQPRAVASPAPQPLPAPAPVAAPAPAPVASVPAPAASTQRGLDAAPQPGLSASAPPRRLWQPGDPSGNADFRAALESRERARGQPGAP